MVKYKNIRIKKRGGGTRLQRVQVLASGKYRFVKNPSKSRSNPKRVKTITRRRRTLARRKNKSRGKRKFTIPIAPIAGIAAGVTRQCPSGRTLVQDVTDGNWNNFMYDARELFAGIDQNGKVKLDWLLATYGPMVVGTMIHKFVGGSPLNLNRMLASAGVPVIRI